MWFNRLSKRLGHGSDTGFWPWILILSFDADFLVINKVEPVELIYLSVLGKHVNKDKTLLQHNEAPKVQLPYMVWLKIERRLIILMIGETKMKPGIHQLGDIYTSLFKTNL